MLRSLTAILIVAVSAPIVSGCAGGGFPAGPAVADHTAQMLVIKGALTYRARVALPPDSHAVIELKDTSVADGRVVAEQRIDLQGRQVPIPFEFAVERARLDEGRQYSVRGAIFTGARAAWVSEPVVIALKQQTIDLGMLTMTPFTAQAFKSDLQCGDQKISIGFVGNTMRVTVGAKSFDMREIGAVSGERYEAAGDPSTTLALKGDRATLVLAGRPYPECVAVGAEKANFRGTGNEPGWRLDIVGDETTLLLNHGQTSMVLVTPPVETTADFRRYKTQAAGKDLAITVFDRNCIDTMSGMPHPNTVVVLYDGKEMHGCGGDPATLLKGEWVAETVDGVAIVVNSRTTLNFGPQDRIHGKASCNTYTGKYSLTGEGLTISDVAVTKMMCEETLMQQEARFLDGLSHVRRFELATDGTLILHTDDRRMIKARRV